MCNLITRFFLLFAFKGEFFFNKKTYSLERENKKNWEVR